MKARAVRTWGQDPPPIYRLLAGLPAGVVLNDAQLEQLAALETASPGALAEALERGFPLEDLLAIEGQIVLHAGQSGLLVPVNPPAPWEPPTGGFSDAE